MPAENTDLLNDMNAELKVEREYFRKALGSHHQKDVRELYELGIKLKNISENTKLYGENAFTKLAKSLGTYTDILYGMRTFGAAYEKDEVVELLAVKTKEGDSYPWTLFHIRQLCRITAKSTRRLIQTRCAENNWSVRQLTTNVQSKVGNGKKKGAGRKPASPAGLNGHLTLFTEMTRVWVDRYTRFGKQLIKLIEEQQNWTKEQRKQLVTLRDKSEEMTEFAANLLVSASSSIRAQDKPSKTMPSPVYSTASTFGSKSSKTASYDEDLVEDN